MPTVLVTGANRGIGLELCKAFAERGYEVIAACRKSSPDLDALGVEVHQGVEVTSDASVRAFAGALGSTKLDVVVLNQGILRPDSLDTLDLAIVREQIEVNALGSLRLVKELLPRLARGSKLALVTSRMGSIGDNTSGGYYGYRMSKAALNMAAASLAHDLRPAGISVCVLHPGYVKTDMTGGQGAVPASEAASQLLARIDALTLETTGSFWHANGERLPW
jgi:NAD(P)-dependent dehydrogenase (short-subunit alcohol dehydrogenase family)